MSKSFLTISVTGLIFITSIIASFVLGVSISQQPASSGLVLINNEVRFEPTAAPDPGPLDDGQTNEGITSVFVYQGVLNDINGDPVAGPVSLSFSLYSNGIAVFEHSSLDTTVTPDAFGRFQVDMPLGDAEIMSNYADLYLQITETGGALIANIPVQYTPRAWYSRHSKTSELAQSASLAETAINAQNSELALQAITAMQADELTNDQTVTLTLDKPFEPYGPPYAVPKAARVGNVVYLSGVANAYLQVLGVETLVTLPVGMRPSERIILTFEAYRSLDFDGFSPHRFELHPDGRILSTSSMNSNEYFSLNGNSFIVD